MPESFDGTLYSILLCTFHKSSISAELTSPICLPGRRSERQARPRQTARRRGIQKQGGEDLAGLQGEAEEDRGEQIL